jgi:hypothetical protein
LPGFGAAASTISARSVALHSVGLIPAAIAGDRLKALVLLYVVAPDDDKEAGGGAP